MDPTASYLNLQRSIEKFLHDAVAAPNSYLLISYEDYDTLYEELKVAKAGVVWKLMAGQAANTGELTLFVGVTSIEDPGGGIRYSMFDAVKAAVDKTGAMPVYDYTGYAADPDYVPETQINMLVLSGPVRFWPLVKEPNGFKTIQLSIKLKYGQIRT